MEKFDVVLTDNEDFNKIQNLLNLLQFSEKI